LKRKKKKEVVETEVEVEVEEENKEEEGHFKDLETLAELRNQGIITEEEFTQKKKVILGL